MNRVTALKPGEIIPLTFDYIFTAIFNKQENIKILENFLSCYLEIPLKEIRGKITILSRNLELENKRVANKQVDLIVDLKGEKINIELSNKINLGIINRNIVYACSIHARQLEYGKDSYNKINRTIQINLNNTRTNEELKETYYLRNKKGKVLSEKFQIDMIDMELGKKLCYTNSETKLARWCRVFTSKTEEEFKEALGDGLMEEEAREKLVEEVNQYSMDDDVIALYSAYTREELERNTIIEDANEMVENVKRELSLELEKSKKEIEKSKKESIKQSKIEIAKKLKNNGIDIHIIEDVTGLTKKQIQTL